MITLGVLKKLAYWQIWHTNTYLTHVTGTLESTQCDPHNVTILNWPSWPHIVTHDDPNGEGNQGQTAKLYHIGKMTQTTKGTQMRNGTQLWQGYQWNYTRSWIPRILHSLGNTYSFVWRISQFLVWLDPLGPLGPSKVKFSKKTLLFG